MTISNSKFGLKEVINASGRMTILGVSKVANSVVEAQKFGGEHFFEMEDLFVKTGSYIAELLEVEDAQIVSSASAGIAQTVAALIGEGSLFHALHPYTEKMKRRDIIIPKGHNVDYGAPVEVMIQQGGGRVVEAGYANVCSTSHVEMLINDNTAAILYVKSHHTVQKSMLSIKEMANLARNYDIPLIVDAAAEEDLFKYINMGADIVIYSGAKSIEGPSAGLVIGKKEYINWIRLQSKGIGRSMKIGKENILGFTQAIETYLENGSETGTDMKKRLEPFCDQLNKISHINASIVQDPAGRDIFRASVKITGKLSAESVISELKKGDPAIYTREYNANNGIIEFDIRSVNEQEMDQIKSRLKEIME